MRKQMVTVAKGRQQHAGVLYAHPLEWELGQEQIPHSQRRRILLGLKHCRRRKHWGINEEQMGEQNTRLDQLSNQTVTGKVETGTETKILSKNMHVDSTKKDYKQMCYEHV